MRKDKRAGKGIGLSAADPQTISVPSVLQSATQSSWIKFAASKVIDPKKRGWKSGYELS